MFSYYGSKAKIAHWYPPLEYSGIIEPFAGAARYSLLHHEGRDVILIERNPLRENTMSQRKSSKLRREVIWTGGSQ